MKLKLNDVYKFHYNEVWSKKIFEPYWCFDGQLIVKERNEQLYLEDTYWNSGDNKTFTLEEALEKGTLTFICNLDDVEKIGELDTQYYDDKDIFNLSYQHHCYIKFCIKEGAKRSADKMKAVLNAKIAESKREIEWETVQVKRNVEKLQELEKGNIDIYL